MQRVKEKDGGDIIKRPLAALLHADERTRDALPIESLRNGLNRRGRRASLRSFQDIVETSLDREDWAMCFGRNLPKLIEWPTHKLAALVTLDDRAITFMGQWPDVRQLKKFKPWNKS